MSQYEMETVEVAAGAYIGWAGAPGQKIAGYVTYYDPKGGSDFGGNVCPLLSVELTEAAYSVNKDGHRDDFGAGEVISITAGQANLKRTITAGNLALGDYIELVYHDTAKSANGTVKLFKLGVARGARPVQDAPHAVQAPAGSVGGQPTQPAAPPLSAPATQPASAPAPTGVDVGDKARQLIALGLSDDQIAAATGLDASVINILRQAA